MILDFRSNSDQKSKIIGPGPGTHEGVGPRKLTGIGHVDSERVRLVGRHRGISGELPDFDGRSKIGLNPIRPVRVPRSGLAHSSVQPCSEEARKMHRRAGWIGAAAAMLAAVAVGVYPLPAGAHGGGST